MTQSLPKAILFDLDGTILANSESAEACWQRVCTKLAPRIEGLGPENLLAAIDETRIWYWGDAERHRRGRLNLDRARREIVAAAFLKLNIDAPDVANEIADSYAVEREMAVRLFPGTIDALSHLRDKGLKLALITNGDAQAQRRKIDRFGLAPLFDHILIEGEFGVGKPDERVYLHALGQLNVRPEDAWMVGDNLEWEVAAPQRLGIGCIWLDAGGSGLPESSPVRPDRIIRTLSELI
jgi:putative hydrolase of the HAD superfamily